MTQLLQWRPRTGGTVIWIAVGCALLGAQLMVLWISGSFAYGIDPRYAPIWQLVALMVVSGIVFLTLLRAVPNTGTGRGLVLWVVGLGLVMRAVMLPSTPILEDDFYRYLWDGAVTSHGINPYAHAPSAAATPPGLGMLAAQSGDIVERVNYPGLRTIYPPVAQAAFAAAHWLAPWSLTGWRVMVIVFELAALGLLFALLRDMNRSPLWSALYWWNPLAIVQLTNAGHMDAIILPFVLGAIWLGSRGRVFLASGSLALAVGVKVWPVLLLPLLLGPIRSNRKKLITAATVFFILTGLLAVPVLLAGLDQTSGFLAYGRHWQVNDALFTVIAWLVANAATPLVAADFDTSFLARLLIGAGLLGTSLWLARGRVVDAETLSSHAMIVVAALFLLSPAQYPWYYVWLLPLLALTPRLSLLSLTALLPLYYLRFYFEARGEPGRFDHGVVWIEHLPVLALLVWEWLRAKRQSIDVSKTGGYGVAR